LIEKIAYHTATIKKEIEAMTKARKEANVLINEADKANAYHDTVLPYFDKIRRATDSLELIVDNEMWTLPKYRELLFIR
jgi:glutamine synthetase